VIGHPVLKVLADHARPRSGQAPDGLEHPRPAGFLRLAAAAACLDVQVDAVLGRLGVPLTNVSPGLNERVHPRVSARRSGGEQVRRVRAPGDPHDVAALGGDPHSYGAEGPGADASCLWPTRGHGRRDRLDLDELAGVAEDDAAEQGAGRVVLAELRPDSVPGRH
jgi:hypothetical protein